MSRPGADIADVTAVAPRRLWWLAAGFGVWCSALVILYATQAVGCVFAWQTATLRALLAAVFLAHLALVGWMWRSAARASAARSDAPVGAFLHTVIAWTLIAAFVATLVTFGPPLLLSTCI